MHMYAHIYKLLLSIQREILGSFNNPPSCGYIRSQSAYRSMYMQNIEQFLVEVFVISGVIKVEVSVIS